jgi:hypothetical protein
MSSTPLVVSRPCALVRDALLHLDQVAVPVPAVNPVVVTTTTESRRPAEEA